MTVQYNTNTIAYSANGASTVFAVPFNFLANAHLVVTTTDTTGLVLQLALGVDYTVTGAGVDAGGTLTFTTAPVDGLLITITRLVPIEQLTSYPLNGILPSKTIEQNVDYLTMIAQQFNTSIANLEALTGTGANQQPDVYQLNAGVLLLRNVINHDVLIPTGYNGMSIFPTIALGVTLSIAVGSVFTTLDPGSGLPTPGGVSLSDANVWTAQNSYGVQNSALTFRLSPTYGDGYISRTATLAANPLSGEANGWAADVQQFTGSLSIVPLHGHALSSGTHSGNAFGIATEAYITPDKNGAGLASKAIGAEFDSIVMISNSTAFQHPGVWSVFKNRLDVQASPVNGVPAGGNAYNKNTAALVVDALARGSITSIECGWNTGLRFNAAGLDSAAGVKATGIDLTPLDAAAPEGGKYYNRVISGLALPDNMYLTMSTNKLTAQMRFNDVGTMEFNNNGSNRFAIGLGNGTLFSWDGVTGSPYTYYLDTAGNAPAIMNVQSGNAARTAAPVDGVTVRVWLAIKIDGTTFRFPGYQ